MIVYVLLIFSLLSCAAPENPQRISSGGWVTSNNGHYIARALPVSPLGSGSVAVDDNQVYLDFLMPTEEMPESAEVLDVVQVSSSNQGSMQGRNQVERRQEVGLTNVNAAFTVSKLYFNSPSSDDNNWVLRVNANVNGVVDAVELPLEIWKNPQNNGNSDDANPKPTCNDIKRLVSSKSGRLFVDISWPKVFKLKPASNDLNLALCSIIDSNPRPVDVPSKISAELFQVDPSGNIIQDELNRLKVAREANLLKVSAMEFPRPSHISPSGYGIEALEFKGTWKLKVKLKWDDFEDTWVISLPPIIARQ